MADDGNGGTATVTVTITVTDVTTGSTVGDSRDTNEDGIIDVQEALTAIAAYFASPRTQQDTSDTLEIIRLYFATR